MTSTQLGAGQLAPTRTEKRYAKVVASIERQQRKLERSDKAVRAAVRSIVKLERSRKRLAKRMAADETAKANAIVTAAVAVPEPVEITAPVEALEIPPFLKRDEKPKVKPRRKVKVSA